MAEMGAKQLGCSKAKRAETGMAGFGREVSKSAIGLSRPTRGLPDGIRVPL